MYSVGLNVAAYVISLLENKLPRRTGIIMFIDALLHVMREYKYKEITLEQLKELRQGIIDEYTRT